MATATEDQKKIQAAYFRSYTSTIAGRAYEPPIDSSPSSDELAAAAIGARDGANKTSPIWMGALLALVRHMQDPALSGGVVGPT